MNVNVPQVLNVYFQSIGVNGIYTGGYAKTEGRALKASAPAILACFQFFFLKCFVCLWFITHY